MKISIRILPLIILVMVISFPREHTASQATIESNIPHCVEESTGNSSILTLDDAVVALEQAREPLKGVDRPREAPVLYCLGLTHYARGSYPINIQPFRDARIYFERSLLAYREISDRAGEALSLYQYGRTYFVVEDFSNTLPKYQEALRIAKSVNNLSIQADVLFDLGVYYSQVSNPQRNLNTAVADFQEAYSIYLQLTNLERQAESLLWLAETKYSLWRVDQARADFESAARLYQQLGNVVNEAQSMYGVAKILHHIGDLHAAEQSYDAVLILFQQASDKANEGRVIGALGNIYYQLGYTIAETTVNQGLQISTTVGDNIGRSIALSYLGEIQLSRNDTGAALSSFESALELAIIAKNTNAEALAYLGRASVYAELAHQGRAELSTALDDFGAAARRYRDLLGDLYSLRHVFIGEAWARYNINPNDKRAYDLFFEARNKAKEVGDKRGEAQSLLTLSEAYIQNFDYTQATTFLFEGVKIASESEDSLLIGDVNATLGEVEILLAQVVKARGHFETALFNYEKVAEVVKSAYTKSRLGEIEQRLGNFESSIEYYQSTIGTLETYDNPRRNQKLIDQTLAKTNLSLGMLFLELNLFPQAQSLLSTAQGQLTSIGDNYHLAIALVNLGDLAFAQHNYATSIDLYRLASRVAEQSSNVRAQALAMVGIGSTLVATGEGGTLEIKEYFDRSLDMIRKINDLDGETRILVRIGESELMRDNQQEAITYFSTAARVATSMFDRRKAGYITLRVAYALSLDPKDQLAVNAKNTYKEAIEHFRSVPDPFGEALALNSLGELSLRRSQFAEAIDLFTQMKIASENANDPIGRAIALKQLGQTYQGQQRYDFALLNYNEAESILKLEVDLFGDLTDQRRLKIVQGSIFTARGGLYRIISQYQLAEVDLNEAKRLLNDNTLLADNEYGLVLISLGELRLDQRDISQALELFENARDIGESAKEDYLYGLAIYGLARVNTNDDDPSNAIEENRLYNLAHDIFRNRIPNPVLAQRITASRGDSYRKLGKYEDARTWYRTAANEAREASNPIGEGYARLQIGDLLTERFLFRDAMVEYQEAQNLFLRAKDWIGEGEALYRLAELALQQVDYLGALDKYQTALALYENEGDLLRQSETLTRIGEAYQRQLRLALALNQHFLAINKLEEAKTEQRIDNLELVSVTTEARIYRNIGITRLAMGQINEAREALDKSLALATQSKDWFEIASTRQIRGRVELIAGNYNGAIALFDEAKTDYAQIKSPQAEGELLIDIGDTRIQLAETADVARLDLLSRARLDYQGAFNIAITIGDTVLEIRSKQGLGRYYNLTGDNQQASEFLVAALNQAEELELDTLRAGILVDLGLVAEERGQREAAIKYYQTAVDLFEDVYADIRLEPGQIAFASQNILPYHRLVALYIETNPQLALSYAERGRARSLLYQLGTEQIDFGVSESADLLAEWQTSREDIRNLYNAIEENLIARKTTTSSVDRNLILDKNIEIRKEIASKEEDLANLKERIDTQSAVLSQVTEVNTRSFDDIRISLDDSTTILSYYIIPPSSADFIGAVYVFIINKNNETISVQKLNIRPNELQAYIEEELVPTFSDNNPEENDIGVYIQLYTDLVLPFISTIEDNQIVIVPHGALNVVPFAALTPDGETFLGDEKTVVYSSSATLYSLLRDDRENELGLIFGSALVFGNPETQARNPGTIGENRGTELKPLPKAEIEAENIAKLLGVTEYIKDQATESLLWLASKNSKIIHVAAHGVFNPENPLASFLALSGDPDNDGLLQVREIYSLGLKENEPLVVLSACDSALGGNIASDDVQSLARAFLISGARSVVATLWSVDDAATQVLMERFYTNLVSNQMTPADALRDAQAFVRDNTEHNWSSPRYWAAFVLVGLPT